MSSVIKRCTKKNARAKKCIPAVGSRAQVMHGNAKHTSGGLEKKDLKYNKSGCIVSVKKSKQAKASFHKVAKVFKAHEF